MAPSFFTSQALPVPDTLQLLRDRSLLDRKILGLLRGGRNCLSKELLDMVQVCPAGARGQTWDYILLVLHWVR